MPQKFPPPPFLTGELAPLNRWLIDIQGILNNSGQIDPQSVAGLPETEAQVVTNTNNITTLQHTTGSQSGQIAALQTRVTANTNNITTNTNSIATINGQITSLNSRAQVFNGSGVPAGGLGSVNDWYADTTNKHIYVKTGTASWTLIV